MEGTTRVTWKAPPGPVLLEALSQADSCGGLHSSALPGRHRRDRDRTAGGQLPPV